MPGLTPADVDHLFSYHPPKGEEDVQRYQRIRDAGRVMARVILKETPGCPDQSVAIRKIREAVMTANAAVACEGRG